MITVSNENRHELWEIGDGSPTILVFEVVEIRASGAELTWILEEFGGIPRITNKHISEITGVRWFGDDAKFIAQFL